MRNTVGWQVEGPSSTLRRTPLERRDLRPDDLAVRVDYCGVCHTDLHAVSGRDGEAGPPLTPGHEFTGVVTETGPAVTGFTVGDPVAVGNIVDSCGECAMCRVGQENFCHAFPTLTYDGTDRHDGSTTLGGYSREYVVRDRFAYPLPPGLDPAAAAPLLCAGVTVWEPLQALGVGPEPRRGGRTGRPGPPRGQDGRVARRRHVGHQPLTRQGRRCPRARSPRSHRLHGPGTDG
ncbi:NADP-dependent alcohol dehydrogenase [Streptomyces viridochromogenes DSM 40736]|uniref:alcohol dehydrogenase (NADP(+)) n=1 Tax=Streptomyces viridochromogenes (strain DSM 40736 / JCM 4977 / BCRC 1201 / Tue 494) TaxID=591159 RepID=D9X9R2_STRVT|nr:NADP-dependent alcohol dehydrogenase [Streptomyces viridochromogenes DSM 40736]